MKLELSERSRLFRRLYCADFVTNDGEPQVVELQATSQIFDPFIVVIGGVEVTVEGMSWDDVVLSHDLPGTPKSGISNWFEHWFDPADKRHSPDAQLQDIIHSLMIDGNEIYVDFGSAQAEAFIDLVTLLGESGASEVQVSLSRGG